MIARLLVALFLLAGTAVAQTTVAPATTAPATTAPATPAAASRPAGLPGPCAIVTLQGEINDYTDQVFEKHVAQAKAAGARTILVRFDTPGGLVVTALRMSQFIKHERGDVKMVAVVHEMAFSAGSMLAVACDRIVMEPGAWIGDCAPIQIGPDGLKTMGQAERAKMESPILADFLDSADRAGYDRLMLSAMVQYGVVVNYLQSPTGEKRFANAADATELKSEGWTDVPGVFNPVDSADTLLTVGDQLAARIGLSAGTVQSPEAYAATLGLPVVGSFDTTVSERVVDFLSNAAVRGLLTTLFLAAVYTAFSKPGTGLPEFAALILGALLLGVPLLTGYAGWFELLLIFGGLALVALELFVIPHFGLGALIGGIMIVVGLVLTFAPPDLPGGGLIPQLQATRTALRNGVYVVTICLVVSMFLWYWLSHYLPAIPYMNRLVLTTSVGSTPEPGDGRQLAEYTWPLVGDAGRSVTRLTPGGVARFFDPIINDDRNVDVVCDHGYVDDGRPVVVRSREGPRVIVRAVEASAEAGTA